MRLGAGIPLIIWGIQDLLAAPEPLKLASSLVRIGAGILLLLGLWTPIAGGIAAFLELVTFLSQIWAGHVYPLDHMLLCVIGTALALLGPGAWSVDARLFGRKLFVTRQSTTRGPL